MVLVSLFLKSLNARAADYKEETSTVKGMSAGLMRWAAILGTARRRKSKALAINVGMGIPAKKTGN
jgi:hypothetical protein